MALFKCKMCGGDLEVNEGATIFECDYCGTKQTVPSPKDDNLKSLYNRANTLRMRAEFDKAEQIYERIVQSDDSEAEAYWGLVLCEYGIEYVEDPKTFKRIPTCHRASFDSVIANENYKLAIEKADALQKSIYEAEAKEIDRIQKEIVEISSKEEPYDVFICYKETDENGKRTQDSVIANDIYYQLTNEGFKVFYAAITLENKLGSAYEPCIFAALNSAKVMLCIGTKPEYFSAVWVRNEWSRFLKIMKTDRSKLLIPCYRDMDAYDLPQEFSHLQAQDMSKIGFINDVVRGIKKAIGTEIESKTTVKESAIDSMNVNIAPLLKRAFMFLEDSNWESANEYCEKVLDQEPECAEAYVCKFLSKYKIDKLAHITNKHFALLNDANFDKAKRYAGANLSNALEEIEENIKLQMYETTIQTIKSARNTKDYKKCVESLILILDYKDSKDLKLLCESKIKKCRSINKKVVILLFAIIGVLLFVASSIYYIFIPYGKFCTLKKELQNKNIEVACDIYINGDFAILQNKAYELLIEAAKEHQENKEYEYAIKYYETLDCDEMIFNMGVELVNSEDFYNAKECFSILQDKKSVQYYNYCSGMCLFDEDIIEAYSFLRKAEGIGRVDLLFFQSDILQQLEKLDGTWKTTIPKIEVGEGKFMPEHDLEFENFYESWRPSLRVRNGKIYAEGKELVFVDNNHFYLGKSENMYFK